MPHDTETNLCSRHIARDYKVLNIEVSANEQAQTISQLWNKLPDDVKLADNVNIFQV